MVLIHFLDHSPVKEGQRKAAIERKEGRKVAKDGDEAKEGVKEAKEGSITVKGGRQKEGAN